jgi:cyclic pyranopterin phosphate synthase
LTLIEVMPLGEVEEDRFDHYLPLSAVREDLARRWTLTPSDHRSGGPARYYEVEGLGIRLGLITPLTQNFCEGCNRIRVTATGELYACLGGAEKVDLRAALRSDAPDANLALALDEAMRIKPERHHFRIERGSGPAQPRHMSLTGG